MRAILQRVNFAQVTVNERKIASIEKGMVILLGIGYGDDRAKAAQMVKKTAQMRIFEDDQGKMNLSLLDIHGAAIVVSQFTLYADTRKGNRPSFIDAAPPALASPLVDFFVAEMRNLNISVQTGEFGAYMKVSLENDGPVTISLEM